MEPITREEKFLNAIATGEPTDLKPITRVERFLYQIAQNIGSGGGGGVYSWNDLKDKPFGEETVVYFEITEDYVPLDQVVTEDGVTFYKVLDEDLTVEQIVGSTGYVRSGENLFEIVATEDDLVVGDGIISSNDAIYAVSDSYEVMGVTLTAGTWIVYNPTFYVEKLAKVTVKTIDPKYLPYTDGNEVEY